MEASKKEKVSSRTEGLARQRTVQVQGEEKSQARERGGEALAWLGWMW